MNNNLLIIFIIALGELPILSYLVYLRIKRSELIKNAVKTRATIVKISTMSGSDSNLRQIAENQADPSFYLHFAFKDTNGHDVQSRVSICNFAGISSSELLEFQQNQPLDIVNQVEAGLQDVIKTIPEELKPAPLKSFGRVSQNKETYDFVVARKKDGGFTGVKAGQVNEIFYDRRNPKNASCSLKHSKLVTIGIFSAATFPFLMAFVVMSGLLDF